MICRMCILESQNLLSIFESETSEVNRAAVITQHFGFEPMKDDPITNMICVSCWTQIDQFHSYYIHVEEAQRKFLHLQLGRPIKEDTNTYEEEVDKKENFLFAFDNECFTTLQETVYEEIPVLDPFLESSKNMCKTENIKYEVIENDEDIDSENNDEDDDDDVDIPEIHVEDVDNQSDFSENMCKTENIKYEVIENDEDIDSENNDEDDDDDVDIPEIHVEDVDNQSDFSENMCKTENIKYEVIENDEDIDSENNDEDDDDDVDIPEIHVEDVDNQSDFSEESSDEEENKPIEMLRREIRQSRLRQNHNSTKMGNIDSVNERIDSSITDKAPPEKRGRKRKTDKPIGLNPRTTEYQMKSKQYDEEIAKRTKLKCDLCEQEFTIFNVLQRHYRAQHKIKGYVVCCGSKFFKRGMFLDHIMKHLEPDRLKCDTCKKTYCSRRVLRDHIRVYHAPDNVKTFQCDQCPRKYLKQYQLNKHKKKHIPKDASQYNCEECGKGFKNNNSLQTHRRSIHETKYAHMCHICAKVLRSRTLYLKHKLVEHEGYVEPKQQCKECGAWLKNAFRLKLHTKKHRERESQFVCNICGKISPSSSALQCHVKFVHEAQRQHQCTFCNKAFKRAISLKEHLTTHTGDVLYTCPHCPKTFNSKANMHSHRKKKHPKEWEEARRIRGAPIAMFGKADADITTNNSAVEDNSLDNTVNSANDECENEIAYDSLKEIA